MRITTTVLGILAAAAMTAGASMPAAAHGDHYSVKRGHVHYAPPRHGHRYRNGRRHGHRHAPSYRRTGPVIVIRTAPVVRHTYGHVTTTAPTSGGGSDIYVYPNQGQSRGLQDRDRYECHRWAYGQTGFDPSAGGDGHSTTSRTEYRRGGELNVVTGAAGGALLGVVGGAVAGDPGKGAAIGAAVGATAGLLGHGARDRSVVTETRTYDSGPGEDYRRAMTACLEGRGYTVR